MFNVQININTDSRTNNPQTISHFSDLVNQICIQAVLYLKISQPETGKIHVLFRKY